MKRVQIVHVAFGPSRGRIDLTAVDETLKNEEIIPLLHHEVVNVEGAARHASDLLPWLLGKENTVYSTVWCEIDKEEDPQYVCKYSFTRT